MFKVNERKTDLVQAKSNIGIMESQFSKRLLLSTIYAKLSTERSELIREIQIFERYQSV
jgi:hypothetical protein